VSKKLGLILFNIIVAVGGATVYAWLVRRDGLNQDAVRRALLEGGSAGFLAGLTIGLGATLGPRPVLGVRKCLKAQLSMAVSSLAGALLVQLFPKQWSEIDRVVEGELRERGLLLGSGVGLVVGTVAQIVQIYFTRRRKAR
jgi:hypothetical protein